MATLSGCQWDPPRDNPLDPGSNAYHYPFGSLKVHVRTLIEQPIADATVLLPELERFAVTDSNGLAEFEEIPTGTWWIVAYRNLSGSDVYATDSAQVTITVKASSEMTMQLDGLPEIKTAYAYSVAFADSDTPIDPTYLIRLKSTVFDPDGVHHLLRVEAVLVDTLNDYSLAIDLRFNADSSFWWSDVPADSFHNDKTDNALFLPFTFRAFDAVGNASPPRTAFVARVLHGIVSLFNGSPPTHLEWTYPSFNELSDPSTFNYHVRIYVDIPPLEEIYWRIVVPRPSASGEHDVDIHLPVGIYLWDVLVLDNFGNSTRSPRLSFTVDGSN